MAYINTQTNQYPISEQDIRNTYPNTSFPFPFVAPEEFAWVFLTPQPTYNSVIEMAREVAPILTEKGTWEQQWEVVSKFQEYTDEQGVTHTVAEQEAAALAEDQANKVKAIQESIVKQTQERLDNFAKTRNYDSILSAASYATSTNAKFKVEGQYAVEARDATWAKLYVIMAEVEAGTRPMPTEFADIEPELPVLTWPQ